ncbi:MAG: response regulator transcription factor [Gammaproteobacteria bacterium]
MRLLLVEDDIKLGPALKKQLSHSGFAVDLCDDGIKAEIIGAIEPYDVIILDLGLPHKNGLEVLQSWRDNNNTVPVIILTARDAWHEKIDGFKAGADDYLTKPFHVEELLLRINAIIKRSKNISSTAVQFAGFTLDEDRQIVTSPDGQEQQLTGTEYRLLRYFILHPGKILSKSILTEHVYENDADKDSNVIEVYVKRLRQKFGKEIIETRRGQGYVFTVKS